jgi:serine/threonine protein kinase
MGQNKLSAVSFTATVCVNIFTVHHIQINALSADNSEQSSIWSNQIEYNTILIQMHVCHNMKNRNNARSTAACGPNALLFITHETGKIRRMWGKHLEDPLKEIQAMQLLEGSNFGDHHPHIMHGQVALQDQKYLYNITPYCKGGDLGGVVMDQINRKSRMDEKDATHWFRQILLALHHLQLKGVCHRNISLENIVVHGDSCKLVDFALALRVPYHQSDTIGGVTDVSDGTNRLLIIPQGQSDNFTFMSPEILNDEVFDGFGIDCGALAWYYISCYLDANRSNVPILLMNSFGDWLYCTLRESLSYWEIKLSDDAIDLLQTMLRFEKDKRLTLEEVMKHPWVVLSVPAEMGKNNNKDSSLSDKYKSLKKRWSRRKQGIPQGC